MLIVEADSPLWQVFSAVPKKATVLNLKQPIWTVLVRPEVWPPLRTLRRGELGLERQSRSVAA